MDGFPAADNIGFTVNNFDTISEAMINQASEPHTRCQRNIETQSPSRPDITTPRSTEVKIAPFPGKGGDQSAYENGRNKWSTVSVNSGDNKIDIATSGRPSPFLAAHVTSIRRTTPFTRLLQAHADIRASRRVSPRLEAFDDVHRQICEQDRLTLEKSYSQLQGCSNIHSDALSSDFEAQHSETIRSNQQSENSKCLIGWKNCGMCEVCSSENVTAASPASKAIDRMLLEAYHATLKDKVYNVDSSLLKDGITVADVPPSSDTPIHEVYVDSPLLKDGVVVTDVPTLGPRHHTTTVAKDNKQAAAPLDNVIHVPHSVCEDSRDSDSGPVPKIRKVVHRTKSSDVMTATGFASSDNTTAPDDIIVGEFLEIADYKFSRDEAFEILRMCGANLIAAISMYRNVRDPDHLRQMLRVWLAPLENDEYEAAARSYSQEVSQQDNACGVSSTKENGMERDGAQPIAATMTVEDALALLGLEVYKSVDMTTLGYSLQSGLSSHGVSPEAVRQLQKAFDTIVKHQNYEDCWELCFTPFPPPWTQPMGEILMGRCPSQEFSHAHVSGFGKDHFKELHPSKEKDLSAKEDKSKKQQQEEPVEATSIRAPSPDLGGCDVSSVGDWGGMSAVCCWECGVYHDPDHDCEAERSACDHNVHEHQPASSVISDPINARETKAPVPTAYTVTYWATIESGNKTVHIPVDSSNVTGPEKNIIEGSTGMKKVWKWAQEKGLSDKISLQDAFDLAKNMHSEDVDDESVGNKPQDTKDTPRTFSRSPRQEWTFPAPGWAAPGAMSRSYERSETSSAGPFWE